MSKPQKVHTTAAGTELPILDLRGKDYLEVKYRIVWFREDHPNWTIETEYLSITEKSACAKATIKTETGRIIATSHKFENMQGFGDFIEKAETGSIGRALALIGYGTQFCGDELDEGGRLADAPAAPVKRAAPLSYSTVKAPATPTGLTKLVVPVGFSVKEPSFTEPKATLQQLKEITEAANANGWTPKDLQAYVQENFKVSKSSDLTTAQATEMLNYIKEEDAPNNDAFDSFEEHA